jgi:hypothetical protein
VCQMCRSTKFTGAAEKGEKKKFMAHGPREIKRASVWWLHFVIFVPFCRSPLRFHHVYRKDLHKMNARRSFVNSICSQQYDSRWPTPVIVLLLGAISRFLEINFSVAAGTVRCLSAVTMPWWVQGQVCCFWWPQLLPIG